MEANQHILTYEEVSRLDEVLSTAIQVHGRGNFPTLEVKPANLIRLLLSSLRDQDITVKDVRLNGSTASYVLNDDQGCMDDLAYNDLDLIFNVEMKSVSNFHQVKSAVLDSLKDFLPDDASKDRICSSTLQEAYVRKMVKVTNKFDNWSLMALTNKDGRNIELKFVDSMRRQFEFSIDSFQIISTQFSNFYDLTEVTIAVKIFTLRLAADLSTGDFDAGKTPSCQQASLLQKIRKEESGRWRWPLFKYCSCCPKTSHCES
eukprot:Seg1276.5 transcript_id=Seg1276.5/GoldUCD/mRNA.D3Y31 product="Terminal nucleotidyltransferase 5A" protein_id=Seg1276.5/GoldUCD/D3Y31